MVEITELNREPASTVSTLTATTEVTSPSVDATDVTSETVTATTEVTSPSVTADALEAKDSITDASGDTHTGELADKDGDDLTPNTIDVATSITDPEGNTVTDLSDPVRVTEEASTFSESDVTVTNNNTVVTNGGIELLVQQDGLFVDDFEDGVDSGWSRDTAELTAVSSPALSQTQSGQFSSNGTSTVESPSVGNSTENLKFKIQLDSLPEIDSLVQVYNSRITRLGEVGFTDGGTIFWDAVSQQSLQSYSANTTYTFELIWDFGSDEVEIIINESSKGTFSLENSVSDWDYIELIARDDGTTHNTYIDNVYVNSTSGDALVEWNSSVPADIDSWDLATFQGTLDNETVAVDVEDGQGNVLFSDIGPNFDISTINTSKNVKLRANLSRNDTSNNPTLDYAARRFTR